MSEVEMRYALVLALLGKGFLDIDAIPMADRIVKYVMTGNVPA